MPSSAVATDFAPNASYLRVSPRLSEAPHDVTHNLQMALVQNFPTMRRALFRPR
jgi:hypothetical protein